MIDALDHQLPQDRDAERALLGSLLLELPRLDDVTPILRAGADELADERNRSVFDVLVDMRRDNMSSFDGVIAKPYFQKRGRWESTGWPYLGDLMNAVPSALRAVYYAGQVHAKYLERQLVIQAHRTIERAASDSLTTDEKIDAAATDILGLVERNIADEPLAIGSLMAEVMRAIEDESDTGLPTPWHEYNQLTGGLQRDELTIVAARPSQGKSAWIHNLADYLAVLSKKRVLLFTVEMGRRPVVMRMLSARCEVPVPVMRRHDLTDTQKFNLKTAREQLERSDLIIDDQTDIKVGELRAKCRVLHRKQPLDAVLVDYLQLVLPDRWDRVREREVAQVSRGLKALAKELHIPVVAAAQLRRASQGQDAKRPTLDSLRESGSIEQDADVVVMIHRPRITEMDGGVPTEKENPVAELLLRKQRNGPTGNFTLNWDGARTAFCEARSPVALELSEPPAREWWP